MVDARFVEDLLAAAPKPAVLITQSERPQSYGVVTVRGKELVAITEKPAEVISNLINTGAYVLDSRIFDEIERLAKEGKNDLPSAVSALATRASVAALLTEGMWVDALYPWDLLRLNAAALKTTAERRAGTIEPAVTIRGRVTIGDGCVIRSGAYLQGPLSIGAGCEIGPNAVLLPSTSLGKNVRIGALTTVANSILMDDVILGPSSVVQESVIGSGVVARAGWLKARGVRGVGRCGRRDGGERPAGQEGQRLHPESRGAPPAVEGLDGLRPHAVGDPRGAVEGERPSARRLHREDRARPQRDHRELCEPAGKAAGPGSQVRESNGHGEPRPPDRSLLRWRPRDRDTEGARRHPRVVRRPRGPRGRTGQGDRGTERESARDRARHGRELPRVGRARPPAVHGPGGVRDGPGDGCDHAERGDDQGLRGPRRETRAAAHHVVPRGRGEGRLRALHVERDPRGAPGDP